MNGLEQRQRHTAIATAEVRLADLSAVVQELDGRIVELAGIVQTLEHRQIALGQATADGFGLVDGSVGQLQADIADLKHDDLEHERVIVRLRPLTAPTFLERLSWFLTGRT